MKRIDALCKNAATLIISEGSYKWLETSGWPGLGNYYVRHEILPLGKVTFRKDKGPYKSISALRNAIAKELKRRWRCKRYLESQCVYDGPLPVLNDPYSFRSFIHNSKRLGLI